MFGGREAKKQGVFFFYFSEMRVFCMAWGYGFPHGRRYTGCLFPLGYSLAVGLENWWNGEGWVIMITKKHCTCMDSKQYHVTG